MEQSTAQLAARLAKNGGTAADWKLLGQAYDFLGRKEDAKAAYAKAAAAPAK
jgi:cytochrome c-type biogenesis protein CcmH/NrfG